MNREAMRRRLDRTAEWDLVVIGGGATGLGAAVEAASRGYQTLLLEQHDFAKATSSRSTKLVHGGVRYLQQGNVPLVMEALKERGLMRRNAPHLVRNLPFIVPIYDWWESPFYGIGLKVYDMLAGRHGFGASRRLSRQETLEAIPTVEPQGLRAGVIYYDGQFDDARLAIHLAMTAADQGAVLLNYCPVTDLIKDEGQVRGVAARDAESGETLEIRSRAVLNATGIFIDQLRRFDDPGAKDMLAVSQGVHIVLDRSFLPGDSAIMVPHTDDGRVLFAIPWHDRVVVGTTDTPVPESVLEPLPLAEELEFLLAHAARYLTRDPVPADVRSAFAGLRPLVQSGDEEDTAALSRDHSVVISESGLVTIAGGKWTTYRRMGEDAVDQAALVGHLPERASVSRTLNIHGYYAEARKFGALAEYGADAPAVEAVLNEREGWADPLHPRLPYRRGEVVWAARHEMARSVDDVLARRTRALLLDARAAAEVAPDVAALLAEVLGRDDAWQPAQVDDFRELARSYWMEG
jgi:glycerol-3-phosphate dehydrogenase